MAVIISRRSSYCPNFATTPPFHLGKETEDQLITGSFLIRNPLRFGTRRGSAFGLTAFKMGVAF